MYRFFICLRYLKTRATAWCAVVAVTVGVATLLTVLSIMEGYIIRLREMIRDQDSHITVHSVTPLGLCDAETIESAIRQVPHVVGTAPTIETLAMYRSDQFSECLLRGILPERALGVTGAGEFFLRPTELDTILEALDPVDHDDEDTMAADEIARGLVSDTGRTPLTPTEVEELFSLAWRRGLVHRLPPAIRERIQRNRRSPPSAVVVGLPFLTSRDLFLGQIIKIMTMRPGTADLVQGNFLVTGAFKTGNFELDSHMFFLHDRRMATFLRTHDPALNESCYETIRVALDDYRHAEEVRKGIEGVLGELPAGTGARSALVFTWEDQKQNFLEAVTIEKWITGFVVSLLNVFTGCIILLMLVLLVIEKRRDGGILLALGATPTGVFSIFLMNGFIITAAGTVSGLALGTLFIDNINTIHDWIHHTTGYQLFDPEVYIMDRIPAVVTPLDAFISTLPALGFGFMASLVPALWAAREDPIRAIHCE